MKASDLTERQRKLILDRQIPDTAIAERLGTNTREVRRQRAKLQATS